MDVILLALAALQYAIAAVQAAGLLIAGAAALTPAPEPAAIVVTDDRALLPIDEDW